MVASTPPILTPPLTRFAMGHRVQSLSYAIRSAPAGHSPSQPSSPDRSRSPGAWPNPSNSLPGNWFMAPSHLGTITCPIPNWLFGTNDRGNRRQGSWRGGPTAMWGKSCVMPGWWMKRPKGWCRLCRAHPGIPGCSAWGWQCSRPLRRAAALRLLRPGRLSETPATNPHRMIINRCRRPSPENARHQWLPWLPGTGGTGLRRPWPARGRR
jgi:hypothetical protein